MRSVFPAWLVCEAQACGLWSSLLGHSLVTAPQPLGHCPGGGCVGRQKAEAREAAGADGNGESLRPACQVS